MTADKPTTPTPRSPFWQAMSLAMELGFVIAIPLVVFSLGGRYVDRAYDTGPWFFLGGLVLAIAVTTVYVYRKFASLLKDVNDQTKT